jgi:hypothetical protein
MKLKRILLEATVDKERKARFEKIGKAFGLRSGSRGAFFTYDGNYEGLDVSMSFDGSGGATIIINVSPRYNPPTSRRVLSYVSVGSRLEFQTFYQGPNGQEKLGKRSFSSVSDLVSSIESEAKDRFKIEETVLKEEFSNDEYKELLRIIRMELASVFFDLYKKRSFWV